MPYQRSQQKNRGTRAPSAPTGSIALTRRENASARSLVPSPRRIPRNPVRTSLCPLCHPPFPPLPACLPEAPVPTPMGSKPLSRLTSDKPGMTWAKGLTLPGCCFLKKLRISQVPQATSTTLVSRVPCEVTDLGTITMSRYTQWHLLVWNQQRSLRSRKRQSRLFQNSQIQSLAPVPSLTPVPWKELRVAQIQSSHFCSPGSSSVKLDNSLTCLMIKLQCFCQMRFVKNLA